MFPTTSISLAWTRVHLESSSRRSFCHRTQQQTFCVVHSITGISQIIILKVESTYIQRVLASLIMILSFLIRSIQNDVEGNRVKLGYFQISISIRFFYRFILYSFNSFLLSHPFSVSISRSIFFRSYYDTMPQNILGFVNAYIFIELL